MNFRITFLLVAMALPILAQNGTRRIERTDEKEVKIRLSYAAGQISLGRTTGDALAEVVSDNSTLRPSIKYKKSRDTGFLDIAVTEDHDIDVSDFGDQRWAVGITDKIPASLECDFGACRGNLDLSGIRLQNLDMNVGASKLTVRFDTPNKEKIHNLKIEAGASNIRLLGLLNSNAERFQFEGGIGSYELDFQGYLQSDMRAKVSVGVGKALIRIPAEANVRIRLKDNIFSVCSIDAADFKKIDDDLYVSRSYGDQGPVLDLELEAGFGKLRVELDR